MSYDEEVAARCASNGALLLDQYDPNWYLHIDLEDFDISNGCRCILGQLYGDNTRDRYQDYVTILHEKFSDYRWQQLTLALSTDYYDLFRRLNKNEFPDAFLGFDVPWGLEEDPSSKWYDWLEQSWVSEINVRRGSAERRAELRRGG